MDTTPYLLDRRGGSVIEDLQHRLDVESTDVVRWAWPGEHTWQHEHKPVDMCQVGASWSALWIPSQRTQRAVTALRLTLELC